jgi:hypothetical protein
MAALRDIKDTIVALMSRGLTSDQIEKAMKKIVGNDWKEVGVQEWFERLKREGFILQNENELSISDLEAFVKGRIMLEDIGKMRK